MAASLAGRLLRYFTFRDRMLAGNVLNEFAEWAMEARASVGELWTALEDMSVDDDIYGRPMNFLEILARFLL